MRTLVLALGFALLTAPAFADAIQPTDASAHVGQTVTVEGTVSNVHTARSGVTFIDMGGRYPNNSFTAVIFAKDASKFPGAGSLNGKTVDITGPVRLYKGKPEIIVKDAAQLKSQ
jgi:DNA/RNA endonuclease YhcR with UshA esterase domain